MSVGGCSEESGPAVSAAEPGTGLAVSATDPSVGAEFVALHGTVVSLQGWSWQHLSTSLKMPDKAGEVPAGLWDEAVANGIRVAGDNHASCEDAALSRKGGDRVEVKVTGCTIPESVVSAVGCVVLAPPAGNVQVVREQAFQNTAGSGLRFVESPAQAAPGTWHVGACD